LNEFDPVRLQIDKAIRAMEFVARRMGQRLFSSEDDRSRWVHDLEVIRRVNNLKAVSAEYVGREKILIFAHEIQFSPNGSANGPVIDSAEGVDSPWCDKELVKLIEANRVTLTEKDPSQARLYRDSLQIKFSTAEPLKKPKGTSVSSRHHEKITGGNNTANFFVCDLARHGGRITHVAEGRGFAFAKDETLGVEVWLHVSHAAKGFVFRRGDRVSYLVVDSPKGLQGRDIRAA
jgi:cold shock CspA family protein